MLLFCLFVSMDCRGLLSVRGLRLVAVVSCLVMEKIIPAQVPSGGRSRQAGMQYILSGR